MSNHERRIQKLSDFLRGQGCPRCRGVEFSRVFVAYPGAPKPDIPPRPSRCEDCGRRIDGHTDVMIIRDPDGDAAIVGG